MGSKAEVVQFIKFLGKSYEQYASAFSDSAIDGNYLATYDLMETFDDLGIENKIHRNMLLREIKSRLPKLNTTGGGGEPAPSPMPDNSGDSYGDDTLPTGEGSIPERDINNRTRSSQSAAANRRRIAEDNIQPSVVLCAWILALIVGMAVFLLDRHATIAKRDAIQRGQRNG